MNIQFNAIDYVRRLEAAGVSKEQAEVQADALQQVLGRCLDAGAETKLRAEMQVMESKILSEMNFLKWMNGVTLALVIGLYVRSWLA